jgi:hypothetical protein
MFTEDMPKIVAGYFKLFEAVEAHFKDRCPVERLSRQGELALIFLTPAGASVLYFAVRWDLWSRMNLPLWLGVRSEWSASGADDFAARNPGRSFMHEGYRLCPLDPAITVDIENPQAVIAGLERELAAAGLAS